jgi:type II secretory pathway component PulF
MIEKWIRRDMKTHHVTRFKKWSRRDLVVFFERLELYFASGLAIDTALHLCEEGARIAHANALEFLKKHIESGSTLSSGLVKYLGLSKTLSGIISQGENTGNLTAAIKLTRNSIEKQDELIKKCVSSMIYPCVIGGFCVIFVIGLMRGVMPQIVPMLQGLHTELPIISRVMISCSKAITDYGLYGGAIFVLLTITAVILYKKKWFKFVIQSFLTKLPLVGSLINNYNIVVFLRSLGTLVDSGLPISDAFRSSVETITFIPIYRLLLPRVGGLSAGLSLDKAFVNVPMPRYIIALVSAGELSGTLGISLLRAADILDRDIELSLKRMTSLIEPLMMIVMGLIVGAIALSILMPIYDLSKTLQH